MNIEQKTEQVGLRTLAEIVADLSKPIPDRFLAEKVKGGAKLTIYTWMTVQKFLDHFAPGWQNFNKPVLSNERVVVDCKLCIPTSDYGLVCRSATGDDSEDDDDDSPQEQRARQYGSPTTRAEGQAFKRAAARFGFGLYLRDKGAGKPQGQQYAPPPRPPRSLVEAGNGAAEGRVQLPDYPTD